MSVPNDDPTTWWWRWRRWLGELPLFADYKIHRELWRIRRDHSRFEDSIWRRYNEAEKAGATKGELHDILIDTVGEQDYLESETAQEHSNFLCRIARQRMIPYPAFSKDSSDWVHHKFTSKVRLSNAAQAALVIAIRKDLKEEAEATRSWTTFILGLIGAITGPIGIVIGFIGWFVR